MKIVDNRGLTCPKPVIQTKKALDEISAESGGHLQLLSIVDNRGAAENVRRLADRYGYQAEVREEADGFYVELKKGEGPPPKREEAWKEDALSCSGEGQNTVFLITSSLLGRGEEELGQILMRAFIFSLTESTELPAKILFLNSGVYLTAQGSPLLEELGVLRDKGVEIFSCGTCLDYYGLKEKLGVGKVTNMYDIVENIMGAGRCVTL